MCKKLIFLISFVFVLFAASNIAQAANEIWFEAEAANPLTSPMMLYDGDPCASSGGYIGVEAGNNSTGGSPAPDGTAHFIFNVPETGTYKVFVRTLRGPDGFNDDSAYARIDGATYSSGSNWIKWNNIAGHTAAEVWEWHAIFNNDASDAEVEFTMDAGQYDLEIAYREDGLFFDAILITDDLALDPATLPSQIPACTENNLLVNGSFEDGFAAPWQFGNATPSYEIIEGGAQDGLKALKVIIAAPGSNEYVPALEQPGLTFEVGKKYTFSVFLKGSYDGMQVFMKPQDRGGSWTGYGAEYKTLTTEWAEYSVTTPEFTSVQNYDHDVSIWLGIQAGTVYIDHARFYEGDYVAPCSSGPVAVEKATKPSPESGATELKRFNLLSWRPGDFADTRNVFFGTDMQAVTDATVDNPLGTTVYQDLDVNSIYVTGLEYGTKYYWRVDEANSTEMAVYPGSVWNFTTKPIGLVVPKSSITVTASSQTDADQGPEKTIDGSGLTGDLHGADKTTMWLSATTTDPNQAWIRYDFDKLYKMPRMLIWNHNLAGAILSGYAMKDVVVEYSSDGGATWTALDLTVLPKGNGSALEPVVVDLGGVADGLSINAFRITALSNYSTIFKNYGLSEVRFYYVPARPTNPSPADGATFVDVKPTLTFEPGEGVVEHKLYFGQNEQAVTNGTAPSFMLADPSYNTPELLLGETYFWRVEEINDTEVWSGDTWSFTITPYTVIDDFEGYTNSIGWPYWQGSSSGNNLATTSLDTTIANNGNQSLSFSYDALTDRSTIYSEIAFRPTWMGGQNWTTGGAKWLVFYVYGDINNKTDEKMYVIINDAKYWNQQILIDHSELVTPWWTQVIVPLIPGEVNLKSVNNLKIGFHPTTSNRGKGKIRIDDIRLYKDLPVVLEPVNPGNANLVAYYKMQNNLNDSSGHGHNGTAIGVPTFVSHEYSGYGKALAFDANSQDVVNLGTSEPNEGFNPAGSFSVSYWANIQDWSSSWGCAMVANRGESGIGWQVRRGSGFGTNGNSLVFTTRGISNDDMYSNKTPPLNQWVHITCVYDSVAFTKAIYFNDKLIRKVNLTGTVTTVKPTTHNATIGARANSGNTGFEALFKGTLDDVRIYNKALTDAEIKFLSDPTP